MSRSLSSLFALYTLTPGRRIYALNRTLARVKEHDLTDLVELIEASTQHDRHALDLDAARVAKVNLNVRRYDTPVDRTLMAISHVLAYHVANGDAAAAAMLANVFPIDADHHTHLPFVEQAVANERVLSILESQDAKSFVDSRGLRPMLEDLRKHHDAFEAALKSRDSTSVPSWDEVKAAHAQGQELYLSVVVAILAQLRDQPELRDELLQPIYAQDLIMQSYHRQRRAIREINPDTGEELASPEADQPQADAEG